jgi:ribose transport system substrate-binding protein
MMAKVTRGRVPLLLIGPILAAVVAGCGSSSSNNTATQAAGSSSSASSTSSTSASGSGSSSGAGSGSMVALRATIQSEETRPTSIGVTTPVSGTIPKGKTIDDIELGEPLGTSQGQDAVAAGKALGWHVVVIDAGTTPQTVQAAWSQALQNHPDGIIGTGGFPHSYYAAQLAQAKSEGIPVIEISDPAPPGDGVVVSLDSQARYVSQGISMAQWVMAEKGLHSNVVAENVPAFTAVNTEMTTMVSYLKSHCPGCSEVLLPVAATSSNMAGEIASAVQTHPNTNVVVASTADFSIGLPSALASIGKSNLTIMTNTQDSSYIDYLKAKSVAAVFAYGTPEWVWRAFDAFARIFTHQSTAPDTADNWPKWWLTPENVPADLAANAFGPIVANYQAQFEKLWHAS